MLYGLTRLDDHGDQLFPEDAMRWLLVGGLVYLGVTIYNLVDAPRAARRANRRRAAATLHF
jgi:hypothetical protein